MKQFVAVACIDSNGSSTMVGYDVECTREQYDDGEHFDMAIELAENDGYTGVSGQFICFDDAEQGSITRMAETIRKKELEFKQSVIKTTPTLT